jgi:diguanylate cyclase (GGDEF)-like protein
MLDVDDFKRVNDIHGHPQGDEVLRAVARVLRHVSRDVDVPARYGGEELAMVLPQTDLDGAYLAAERVRAAIAALEVLPPGGADALRMTVSLGVAAATRASAKDLIAAADGALYAAKRAGKNRTARGSVASGDVV